MEFVKKFLKWFLRINTGIVIVCTVNVILMNYDYIRSDILSNILIAAFVTTFITLGMLEVGERAKLPMIVTTLIHYVLLTIVMVWFGNMFGWMDLTAKGVIMMSISVACVYALSYVSGYLLDVRQADEINKRLKEKYGDGE